MGVISFQKHQHQNCLNHALEEAETLCQQQGERLTALRRAVLELVWASHEPVKAYDLLAELKKQHPSSQPPTVYRALDFLQAKGLVHKIETLNAYLGCGTPSSEHSSQFFICRDCGSVAEIENSRSDNELEKIADSINFRVEKTTIEVLGLCQQCQ